MCIIYSIYIFQSEKLLTPVERAQNFTYSGVKTPKCQNFEIDHYNCQRLKWLTAFVCDAGLFEFNRLPFGLKCNGNSFVRAITKILRPIRESTDSFVDQCKKTYQFITQ